MNSETENPQVNMTKVSIKVEIQIKINKETKGNNISELVDKYNEAMKNAPTKLYGIYICLYVHGGTQESIANEMSYTPFYIYKLNNKLIEFLYKVFNEG